MFFVWCFIPIHNNGSIILYTKVIRPYFLKHEGDIDQAVNEFSKKGKKISFNSIAYCILSIII